MFFQTLGCLEIQGASRIRRHIVGPAGQAVGVVTIVVPLHERRQGVLGHKLLEVEILAVDIVSEHRWILGVRLHVECGRLGG